MHESFENGDRVYRWSIWEALEAITGPEPEPKGKSRYDDPERRIWSGSSLEDCRQWMREGWEAGAVKLDLGDRMLTTLEVDDFEYRYAEEGADVDVPLYLSGEPACMGDVRWTRLPKPVIRVGVDIAYPWTIDTETLLAAGRSILTMVESLRSQGYPTEIHCEWRIGPESGSGTPLRAIVEVQRSDQPVHGGLLAFWVGHPSAMRRGIEALVETLPIEVRKQYGFTERGGYGLALDMRASDYDEAAPSAKNGLGPVQAWCAEVLERRS